VGYAASGAALLRGLRCFGGCGIARVYVMVVGVGLQTASKAVACCQRVSVSISWSWRKVAKHGAGEKSLGMKLANFHLNANF